MNTPGHVIVNLVALAGGDRRALARPVFWGALLPDLPMFFFFLWERGVLGTPDAVIWRESYYAAHWQDFFDLFNSIPLALLGLAAAHRLKSTPARALFASMLLHHLLDLPLHHDDAHRHFFPLSHYRFESPISYWDPTHHGTWAALTEVLLVWTGAYLLTRRYPSTRSRALLTTVALLYAAGWTIFYLPKS